MNPIPLSVWLIAACFLLAGQAYKAQFVEPTHEILTSALGPVSTMNPSAQRAFLEAGAFEAKKKPGPTDWLSTQTEFGQTYDQFVQGPRNIPRDKRIKLYILPIGEFDKNLAPDLEKLRLYMAAYFYPLAVEMLPVKADVEVPATSRINPGTKKTQWLTTDILGWMQKQLPVDAYAMLALTMTDLYPDESWNFVFGQAMTEQRVGVFSFARYHPAWSGGKADDSTRTLVLRRALKVLTHETGHMFGMNHCIYYECNMNGVNNLVEADTTPMHLCPVCLRKLQRATLFDPLKRYEKLQEFASANGLNEEADWIKQRIKFIQADQ